MLLVGFGCFLATDSAAMLVVRKTQLTSKIRWCSQGCLESIKRIKIANAYYIDWYKDRINEQQQKKLCIIKDSLHLDVADYHYDKDVFKATVDLTKCDLKIRKLCDEIIALKKENKDLEKKHRDWERS